MQRVAGGAIKTVASKALLWLARRPKTVSKHIWRHTKRLARTQHSVFAKAGQVRKLVQATIRRADRVYTQVGRRIGGAKGQLIEKVIFVRQFPRAVGKNGERFVKVVVNGKTGEVITAYPVQSLNAAAAPMFLMIDDLAANTKPQLDAVQQRAEQITESQSTSFWEELALSVITFGLYGGSLNEGEDAAIFLTKARERILSSATADVIKEIEEAQQRSLSQEERDQIAEHVEAAIVQGDALRALEEDSSQDEVEK